jgi:hypothetical protein
VATVIAFRRLERMVLRVFFRSLRFLIFLGVAPAFSFAGCSPAMTHVKKWIRRIGFHSLLIWQVPDLQGKLESTTGCDISAATR